MLPLTRSRNRARFFGIPFSPSALFQGGTVAGAWYDPSDLSTMFTTDAGTTPVAMPGQGSAVSVGRMLDKSGNGNHAISFNNTTARPELRARVNLLTYSEEFDNGAWTKTGFNAFGSGSVANTTATLDPLGGNTADYIQENSANSTHQVNPASGLPVTAGTYVGSVFAKAAQRSRLLLGIWSGSNYEICQFDLANGVILQEAVPGIASIQPAGNGWWKCSVSRTIGSVSTFLTFGPYLNSNVPNLISVMPSYTGDGTSGIYIWGADLRPANIGANVPAYQRIADANTYDTNGFPLYLFFDGIDDSMYTPASIPFATVTSDGLARRNLLSNPTQFDAAAWTATNLTVTANTAAAPDGTTTADTLDDASASFGSLSQIVSSLANSAYNFSVYIKSSGVASDVRIDLYTTVGEQFFAIFNSGTGAYVSGNGVIYTTASVGNGWYRVSLSASGSGNTTVRVYPAGGSAGATGSIFLWGAQLETGSTATAFQNIGTDKVSVFAGVRKLSDAARGIVTELSSGTTGGTFNINAPNAATPTYSVFSSGTVGNGPIASASTFAAPITNVLTFQSSISAPSMTLRANTIEIVNNASTQGTGNFGTYPLYVGSRNNSSLWLNGQLYSLIIAGSAVSAGNISATESWVAGKTGIQI